MKRAIIRSVSVTATIGVATWMAAACSIDDRTVDYDCVQSDGCLDADGGGSGGKGSGGKAGSGGSSPGSGGKGSGGAQNTGGGGSGGKAGSGGSSPGTGGSGGASATLEQAIRRMATADCRLADGCAPFFVTISYGDEEGCIERSMIVNRWLAGVPGGHNDIALYDACAEAYEQAFENDDCGPSYAPAPPAACRVPGDLENGQPCHAFNQCASLHCVTEGYNCGVCAPQPASGVACTFNSDCRLGEACGPNKRCAVPRKRNETCSATAACEVPLSCYQGTCIDSPIRAGATCDSANGLFCDSTYGVACNGTQCVDIGTADVRETCDLPQIYCVNMGYCNAGTCEAGPADGAACNPENGQECKWPAVCYGGFCQLPGEGTSCDEPAPAPGN